MKNIRVLAIISFKRLVGDCHAGIKLGKQKTSQYLLVLFNNRFFPSKKRCFKSLCFPVILSDFILSDFQVFNTSLKTKQNFIFDGGHV